MQRNPILALALCAGALTSQNPAPATLAGAADARPVFDRCDATLWVATPTWKASFAEDGTTFVPFLGSQASRNWPVTLRLAAVQVDERPIALTVGAVARDGTRVTLDHGAIVEEYAVRDDGLEQSFRITALDRRGELRLQLGSTSELHPRLVDGEVLFTGGEGGVRYGRALAFDAAGRSCTVETRLLDDRIELVVPAGFVADASLPLVVDPLIAPMTTIGTLSRQTLSVDLAWSESLQRYAACYERVWSATDSDVYVSLLDPTMHTVGNTLAVDISVVSWRKCRIASTETVAQQLVVAEVSNGNATPFSIRGRMVVHAPTPALNPAFDIAVPTPSGRTNGDCTDPDVGGDPASGTTYFSVVWQQTVTPLDADILLNQVTSAGAVRFATPVVLDDTGAISMSPHISKSDGAAPFATQGWAVVWGNRAPLSTQMTIRCGIVSWNGLPRSFNGVPSFEVYAAQVHIDEGWDISSPTDDVGGNRKYVIVERWQTGFGGISAAAVDRNGTVLNNTTSLFSSSQRVYRDPVVDCDGCRFAVAGVYQNANGDDDAEVLTTYEAGGVFHFQEHVDLAVQGGDENELAVVARHSGGGARMTFGTAWAHRTAASSWSVEARPYEARTPGDIATRATGCGSVGIVADGTPALGVHFEIHASANGATLGILAGVPLQGAVPICSGCLLGVQGTAYVTDTMAFDIPCSYGLINGVVSFQAFALGGGSCLGNLGLSDTLDVTIR